MKSVFRVMLACLVLTGLFFAGVFVLDSAAQSGYVKSDVKIVKSAIINEIDAITGFTNVECRASQEKRNAYIASRDQCAASAEANPVAKTDFLLCANTSLGNCTSLISSMRAVTCATSPAPGGCMGEYENFVIANIGCKTCPDLKNKLATIASLKASANGAITQAEADKERAKQTSDANLAVSSHTKLIRARAALSLLEKQSYIISEKMKSVCSASAK